MLWDPQKPDALMFGVPFEDDPNDPDGADRFKNGNKVTAMRFRKTGAYKTHSLREAEAVEINTDATAIMQILIARYIDTALPWAQFLQLSGWPHVVVANLLTFASADRGGLIAAPDEAELVRDRLRCLRAVRRAFAAKE